MKMHVKWRLDLETLKQCQITQMDTVKTANENDNHMM